MCGAARMGTGGAEVVGFVGALLEGDDGSQAEGRSRRAAKASRVPRGRGGGRGAGGGR